MKAILNAARVIVLRTLIMLTVGLAVTFAGFVLGAIAQWVLSPWLHVPFAEVGAIAAFISHIWKEAQ